MLLFSLSICLIPFIINNMKLKSKKFIAYYSTFFIGSVILYFSNNQPMDLFLYIISTIVIFYIITKKVYHTILTCVFSIIITLLAQAFFESINIISIKFIGQELFSNPKSYLVFTLLSAIFMYLVSKFCGRFFKNILKSEVYVKLYKKEIFLIVLSAILLMSFTWSINFLYEDMSRSRNSFFAISYGFITGFLILIILFMYSFYKNVKSQLQQKHKEIEYSQLNEYTNNIEKMLNSLRSFKHDYLNILYVLGGYIEAEDMTGLNQFYKNELLPESKEVLIKNNSYILMDHIKINPLKTLIYSKIVNAQSEGIKTSIEIIDDIDEIHMEIIDICRIIGILLDNAIEAAILTEEKIVKVVIVKNDTKVTFIISNSCLENTPPVYKIYEDGFTTKGADRGIGLKNVREIIDKKYKNVLLNTKIENLTFNQELNISI